MTDQELIAELRSFYSLSDVPDAAADRIEELEAACWQMKEDRDRAIGLRGHDKTRAETAEAKLTECEARLGKAVEALREIDADCVSRGAIKYIIRAVLAELEDGK